MTRVAIHQIVSMIILTIKGRLMLRGETNRSDCTIIQPISAMSWTVRNDEMRFARSRMFDTCCTCISMEEYPPLKRKNTLYTFYQGTVHGPLVEGRKHGCDREEPYQYIIYIATLPGSPLYHYIAQGCR